MALFNRDYDRDLGYRESGRSSYRAGAWNRGSADWDQGGYDRDLGDRMRSGWNRMKHGARETFGMNDYDRGYGMGSRDLGYDTTYRRAYGGYNPRNYLNQSTRDYSGEFRNYGTRPGGYAAYDRDLSYRGTSMSGTGDYDREVGLGYGSEYKTRQQTDMGDPFGDRQARTPIRMIRRRDRDYDAGLHTGSRGYTSYERDYSTHPMSYEPYRPGYHGGYDRGFNRNF